METYLLDQNTLQHMVQPNKANHITGSARMCYKPPLKAYHMGIVATVHH